MSETKTIKIEILNVGAPAFIKTAKGGYNKLDVAYKNLSFQNKVEGKGLIDFNNKDVFHAVQSFKPGQQVFVNMVKNAKGYWDWTGFAEATSGPEPTKEADAGAAVGRATSNISAGGVGAGGRVTGSNYETPAERKLRRDFEAVKHRQIGRQGCLNIALSFCEANKLKPELSTVIEYAKEFEDYVFGGQESNEEVAQQSTNHVPGLGGMTDDIPF